MKISTILDPIDSGHMALPDLQRGSEWNPEQARGLFGSLYKRQPAVELLTWGKESHTSLHTPVSHI